MLHTIRKFYGVRSIIISHDNRYSDVQALQMKSNAHSVLPTNRNRHAVLKTTLLRNKKLTEAAQSRFSRNSGLIRNRPRQFPHRCVDRRGDGQWCREISRITRNMLHRMRVRATFVVSLCSNSTRRAQPDFVEDSDL